MNELFDELNDKSLSFLVIISFYTLFYRRPCFGIKEEEKTALIISHPITAVFNIRKEIYICVQLRLISISCGKHLMKMTQKNPTKMMLKIGY